MPTVLHSIMPKELATTCARGDDRRAHACSRSAFPKATTYPQPRPTASTNMRKHQSLSALLHPEISYQFTNSFIYGSRIILRPPQRTVFSSSWPAKTNIWELWVHKKKSWLEEVPEVIVREAVSWVQSAKVMLSPKLYGGHQVALWTSLSQGHSPQDLHMILPGIITALRTQATQLTGKLIFLYLEVFHSLSELRMSK